MSCSTGGALLGLGSIDLTVNVGTSVTPGSYTITLTGTSGSLTHSISFPFNVADYSGTLNQTAVTLAAGASASITASLSATSGFNDTVYLSCAGSSEITCNITSAQLTGGSPLTTTIVISASSYANNRPASTYPRILAPMGLLLPWGIVLVGWRSRKTRILAITAIAALFVAILCVPSCGGGGGSSSPKPPPNSYDALTVSASAQGTGTARTLGTVTVTVTH